MCERCGQGVGGGGDCALGVRGVEVRLVIMSFFVLRSQTRIEASITRATKEEPVGTLLWDMPSGFPTQPTGRALETSWRSVARLSHPDAHSKNCNPKTPPSPKL